MKKSYLLILFSCCFHFLFAAFTIPSKVNESKLAKSELTVATVSKMSFKTFRKHTGEKSDFKSRMAFLMLKKELKQQTKLGHGNMNIAPVLGTMMDDARFRFKLGGFAAGLLFGIFGVGLTYLITKDRNVHRSAWIGFGLLIIIALISIFSIFPA